MYNTIFSMQNESVSIIKYITNLTEKILLLKNEELSIDKKIIKLFKLIQENIPTKEDQLVMIQVYKKILGIFL
jgi:hypothetical protein